MTLYASNMPCLSARNIERDSRREEDHAAGGLGSSSDLINENQNRNKVEYSAEIGEVVEGEFQGDDGDQGSILDDYQLTKDRSRRN